MAASDDNHPRLLPGEKMVMTPEGVPLTLTNLRVLLDETEKGESRYLTVTLDAIASCGVVIAYFTRRSAMLTISSRSGEHIAVPAKGIGRREIIQFIDAVDAAKVELLKRLTIIVLVCFAVAGRPAVAAPDASAPAGGDQITVGSKVVVAIPNLGFQWGTVTSVDASVVLVERTDPTGRKWSASADRSRVWRADLPPRPPAREGEYMICEGMGDLPDGPPSPCRVTAVKQTSASCEDSFGSRMNCEPQRLVRPDPATQAAIKKYLDRQARSRAFEATARAAGKPSKPTGWKPRPGAKILVLTNASTGDWSAGVVKAVRKKEIVVSGISKWDTTLDADTVLVPVPTRAQRASVGDYVLTEWLPSWWRYAIVVAVHERSFEVANGYDEHKDVGATAIIPVGRPSSDGERHPDPEFNPDTLTRP